MEEKQAKKSRIEKLGLMCILFSQKKKKKFDMHLIWDGHCYYLCFSLKLK